MWNHFIEYLQMTYPRNLMKIVFNMMREGRRYTELGLESVTGMVLGTVQKYLTLS